MSAPEDAGLERAARDMLTDCAAVDLHTDPLLWTRLCGYDLNRRHVNRLPGSPFWAHSDVPRWREAGVRMALTGVVTLPGLRGLERGTFTQAQTTVALARRAADDSAGALRLVTDEASFQGARRGDHVGALLALEGAHALEGSLDNLDGLHHLGLRSVGLAHFTRNAATAPSYGVGGDRGPLSDAARSGEGLTAFGRDLIAALEAKRMLIDLAHTSRASFLETARTVKTPVFVSHTGIARAFPHWRNVDDEQLRAVAARDGIVGVIFAGRYLGGSSVERVVDHVEAIIQVVGERHAAIGSDFDGMIVPVRDLPDITALWRVAATMLRRGHPAERIRAVLGGNAWRFVAAATGWRLESS